MSAAEVQAGHRRLLAAVGSGDAFQYSAAAVFFVVGTVASLVTQVGIFDSALNFWASVSVAVTLNISIALLVVALYAFWIEEHRPISPLLLLVVAMFIGVLRIWLSHQLQETVGIPSLLHSTLGYVAGAAQGLFWFVPMSLLFHNAQRFNDERSRLLSELVDNQLRERRRTLLTNTLTEEMTRSVAARVAQSVSATRSSLATALTYSDSELALREIAHALRAAVDRDIRPMSRELWAQSPPSDVRLSWGTLIRLSCYEKPFPLLIIAMLTIGLGLPLSLSLPDPEAGVLVHFLQVGLLLAYLWLVDHYVPIRGARGYWLAVAGSTISVLLPSLAVTGFDWSAADRQFWFTSALFGVPLLVLFASIVTGLAGTREAVLERVRKYVDETSVARELSERELRFASQQLARHLHSSLQGRLMAISLELERAADEGRGSAMRDVLNRLDTLLETPLVGAFEVDAVDVESALQKLIAEWSAVADVTLDYHANWSGPLEHGRLVVGIAEEAIANAVRHGHAKHIVLRVHGAGADAIVIIENDGATPPVGQPGLGTRWIDQVSQTDWSLDPVEGGGMRLRVRLANVIPVGIS